MVIILVVTGILGGGIDVNYCVTSFRFQPASKKSLEVESHFYLLLLSLFRRIKPFSVEKNSLEDEQQKVLKNDAFKL